MNLPSYAMGQNEFPQIYERELVGPLFRPWAETMIEAIALSHGDRVLDIACGTGIVARLAAERLGDTGEIVGVDISADMLAVARDLGPGIAWREGSASALPLQDGEQFDVITCQQGLQFFPDKSGAAAQMRRALAQRGRLVVATWRSDHEIPFFRELRSVAERHLGPIADQRYSFGDGNALEALLRDAGFRDARSRTLSRTMRFKDGAVFLRLNTMALVGMSDAGKAMANAERERILTAIVRESAAVLAKYAEGEGLAFELRSNLATAKG